MLVGRGFGFRVGLAFGVWFASFSYRLWLILVWLPISVLPSWKYNSYLAKLRTCHWRQEGFAQRRACMSALDDLGWLFPFCNIPSSRFWLGSMSHWRGRHLASFPFLFLFFLWGGLFRWNFPVHRNTVWYGIVWYLPMIRYDDERRTILSLLRGRATVAPVELLLFFLIFGKAFRINYFGISRGGSFFFPCSKTVSFHFLRYFIFSSALSAICYRSRWGTS